MPDNDEPAGGVRVCYRHVDILNEAGIRAFVLHQSPKFRCTWFESATPIMGVKDAVVGAEDLLVLSELDADLAVAQSFKGPHVIFNQSFFLTWQRDAAGVDAHYRHSESLKGIVTVSDYAKHALQSSFPQMSVYRVHLGFDQEVFRPVWARASGIISYMPRRGGDRDASAINYMMSAFGCSQRWRIAPIARLSSEGVAHSLQNSQIFLALSPQEGFGLPPVEAMACGNYVVGYTGCAGREYLLPQFSSPVENGDVAGLATALRLALQQELMEPGWLRGRGLQAAEFVAREYSPTKEANDVVDIYGQFLHV